MNRFLGWTATLFTIGLVVALIANTPDGFDIVGSILGGVGRAIAGIWTGIAVPLVEGVGKTLQAWADSQ